MWPKLNTMKHFVTLVACFTSFIALAQNPNYDPDSNGDNLIGVADLASLLAVYNTMLPIDSLNVAYFTDLDTVGYYDGEAMHGLPLDADVVVQNPDHPISLLVVLQPQKRKSIILEEGFWVEDSILGIGGPPARSLRPYVFIDGRWFAL